MDDATKDFLLGEHLRSVVETLNMFRFKAMHDNPDDGPAFDKVTIYLADQAATLFGGLE